jgi:Predicted signal transduction protein containing EAL and modified HD-GYP domains
MGCLACQPILNTKKRIFGYELLYRTSPNSTEYDAADGSAATRELLATAFGDVGIKKITGGQRSFVNFPARLLEEDIPLLYSKDILVVEVLESVQPTEENIAAIQRLKKHGYMVALDDFTFQDGYEPLLRLADIVKVDFLQYPNRDDLERLLRKIRRVGDKVLLAEKVETIEDFDMARELGFTLFQGFFFSRPKLHSGRHLSPMELSRLQLLRCLREDEMDFQQVAEIIKRDVVLSHKLLRIVNSSHYGLSFFVSSILHALTILGTEGTRKWISFAVLQDSAGDSEQELSRMALTRGLFMEKLTIPLHRRREKETFFLFGLFSMADVLMKVPMDEVLSQTNLSSKITKPLLDGEGDFADLLRIVIGYERADWGSTTEIAERFRLDEDLLAKYYLEALKEAIEML